MAVSLIMVSCNGSTEEEEVVEEGGTETVVITEKEGTEEEEAVVELEEEKEMVTDSLGRSVQKPEYGGSYTLYATSSPSYWDWAYSMTAGCWQNVYTEESLITGDWTKGPSGTGETSFSLNILPPVSIMTGLLAESFEIPDNETIIYKIRKGVHFHNKPPTNGREMTAYDVEYSVNRGFTIPVSLFSHSYGIGRTIESIKATDKWTVVYKCVPGQMYNMYFYYNCVGFTVIPHEVIDQYGDMTAWQNNCGTGPFEITDYVTDSMIKYKKNSDYWGTNPFHPENRLPYIDKLNLMIIADPSSRQAAFRTGKIDQMTFTLEQHSDFSIRIPDLVWKKYLTTEGYPMIMWRVDNPPFDDVKVRRAMSMAIDRQGMSEDYYGGDAVILTTGCLPIPDLMGYYTPLEELPESVQEVYTYNPEKAKALLAEAGYPNGFKTNVVCVSSDVDLLSILSAYWQAINVDLEMQIVESGAFLGITNTKAYDQMITCASSAYRPEVPTTWLYGNRANKGEINDERVNEAYVKCVETAVTNRTENMRLSKDILQYVMDQAYTLETPLPYSYIGWWPWVKGYNGEMIMGGRPNQNNYPKYIWIDQELKESMGY
jgi:peptide/nickel transport system substrate-binding protein